MIVASFPRGSFCAPGREERLDVALKKFTRRMLMNSSLAVRNIHNVDTSTKKPLKLQRLRRKGRTYLDGYMTW